MSEADEVSKEKKIEKLVSKINWKYVAIYSCLTLLTGLVLLVVNVSNETNRPLFFALGGTLVLIGSVCILLSCCFYDEFKEVDPATAKQMAGVCDGSRLHRISSSTGTSLASGSPTSLSPPDAPWSHKSSIAAPMAFLTVPREVLGYDHSRGSISSVRSSTSAPPFSVSIVLPRVSV